MSVLENTEVGLAVVDTSGQTVYINSSARRLLECDARSIPDWAIENLKPMLERMQSTGEQVVERWSHADATYRVRSRALNEWSGHIVLEITVAHAAQGQQVGDLLSRSLKLSRSDARLLELLWRGMSNEEIANQLGVRIGTVKSRLFRLYQKLGVRRRPAAVLRAAEVIAA
jgi:ATP/maltotriose-dependent transcriptional regulator MalT